MTHAKKSRGRAALAFTLLLALGAAHPGAAQPRAGEPAQPIAPVPRAGVVNINTADSELLQKLPGIGPARARAILEHRSQVGRFRSVEDLLEVRGIGPRALERLRPLCTVSGLSTLP